MLSKKDFYNVIEKTQLVSIDILIVDENDNLLVGRRINNPAKGYYFVPGSRIYKNELLNDAIKRLSKMEIGIEVDSKDAEFVGVYDHVYNTNFLDSEFGTHYVCIACRYRISNNQKDIINENMLGQHDDIKWFSKDEILERSDVHDNTKNYYRSCTTKFC